MVPVRRAIAAVATALAVAGGAGAPGAAAGPAPVTPNDPGLSRQWGLLRIGAGTAWATATGADITIAIVDSGIALDHPDLALKVTGGADCVEHEESPGGCVDGAGIDDAGHGTHVAGIAAATADNGNGVAGVAPLASVLSVRVLSLPEGCSTASQPDCDPSGSATDVAQGIEWAADHGADVINLSLGSFTQQLLGPSFFDALDYAWAKGSIPVIAAGNDDLTGSLFDVPAVIVAATDSADQLASYSSGVGNVRWGIAAPGGERDDTASCASERPNGILSTWYRPASDGQPTGNSYACLSGTSMAAPFVSGALAVLRSVGFEPRDAVERMLDAADDLGDPALGAGRLNLARALEGIPPTGQPIRTQQNGGPTTTPEPTTTTPAATPPTEPGSGATIPAAPTTLAPSATVPDPTPTSGLDGRDERSAPLVEAPGGDDDGPLPAAPLTLAVLAVIATLGAHAWHALANASWARRTPRR